MHELSLAASILRLVEEAAARERFDRVAQLRLLAGALAGVEIEALSFALEAIAPGTCLEGAQITIDELPGQAWCARCEADVPVEDRAAACPRCGSAPLRISGGTELRVVEVLVAEDQRSSSCA